MDDQTVASQIRHLQPPRDNWYFRLALDVHGKGRQVAQVPSADGTVVVPGILWIEVFAG